MPALSPERGVERSEVVFVVLAIMSLASLGLGYVAHTTASSDEISGALILVPAGFLMSVVSIIPLTWALITNRGRVAAPVWWALGTLSSVMLLINVLLPLLATPACTQSVPC